MQVLIVDDSRSSLALLGSIVREIVGDTVDLCLDPVEALRLCAERQYDLILVDHIMPGMDGIEFTQALRQRDAYRSVPMVMVTSDIDKAIRIESIRAGANDFLTKPFDPIELQARVNNLLALRRAQVERVADERRHRAIEHPDAAGEGEIQKRREQRRPVS